MDCEGPTQYISDRSVSVMETDMEEEQLLRSSEDAGKQNDSQYVVYGINVSSTPTIKGSWKDSTPDELSR